MRIRHIIAGFLIVATSFAQTPSDKGKPLTREQLQQLVGAGMDNERLAEMVKERGIDFEPTKQDIDALLKGGAQEPLLGALRRYAAAPLTKKQVLGLIVGQVSASRVASLVSERGIYFEPTEQLLETLRIAGADEVVLQALHRAERKLLFESSSVLTGHAESVSCLAFSPDGRYLASGSADKTIKLWEVATGQEVRTLTGHTREVSGLAFSPDGKSLLSGSYDRRVTLWEVATGATGNFSTGTMVASVGFRADGKYIASGGVGGPIELWDLSSGKRVARQVGRDLGQSVAVYSIAFSPDGRYIASGASDSMVRVWEVYTGQEVRTIAGHAKGYGVFSVAFSPDGKYLTSASNDKTVRLWDVATGQEVRTMTSQFGGLSSVAFSPDGTYIATCGHRNDAIEIWEAASGRLTAILKVSNFASVSNVAFSPDGWYLASAENKTVRLWQRIE